MKHFFIFLLTLLSIPHAVNGEGILAIPLGEIVAYGTVASAFIDYTCRDSQKVSYLFRKNPKSTQYQIAEYLLIIKATTKTKTRFYKFSSDLKSFTPRAFLCSLDALLKKNFKPDELVTLRITPKITTTRDKEYFFAPFEVRSDDKWIEQELADRITPSNESLTPDKIKNDSAVSSPLPLDRVIEFSCISSCFALMVGLLVKML